MSRARSFLVITCVYLVALVAAFMTHQSFADPRAVTALLAADLVAMAVVFAGSVAVNNSSMYDPYWSVAPPVIAATLLLPAPSLRAWLVVGLVVLWAIRLTANWARGFHGMQHEDWRYVDIRHKTKRFYWVASFFGIHLFPTLIVFLACLPLWQVGQHSAPLSWLDIAASVVGYGAVFIEWTADEQLRAFRAEPRNAGQPITTGLWKHSRHPNYLGEIGFWWGLGLFGLASRRLPTIEAAAWSLGGALAIYLMFVLATIRMAEKRALQRRPEYAARFERTRMLLPFPRTPRTRRRQSGSR